mmetsp:Transcript_56257/g.163103  ORF Transcript_56257/g.163103 Transcript_56257/m.163103 type:complete len:141 (+) Transcript_56257:97-519(+)
MMRPAGSVAGLLARSGSSFTGARAAGAIPTWLPFLRRASFVVGTRSSAAIIAGTRAVAASTLRTSHGDSNRDGMTGTVVRKFRLGTETAAPIGETQSAESFIRAWNLGDDTTVQRCLAPGNPLTRAERYALREALMLEFM